MSTHTQSGVIIINIPNNLYFANETHTGRDTECGSSVLNTRRVLASIFFTKIGQDMLFHLEDKSFFMEKK